jgi:deoxyribodipyrimidine photo-lyase
MKDLGIFIFRRDYRTKDNIGLYECAKQCKLIIPIFIFTPEQVSDSNKYKSANAVQFMIEALDDLNQQTGNKLACYYGDNVSILNKLINAYKPEVVAFNRDYTPYAIKRDKAIMELCAKKGVECLTYADYYLFEPGTLTKDGYSPISEGNKPEGLQETVYKKFTPFYNKAKVNKRHIVNSVGQVSVEKLKHVDGSITLTDAYQRFGAMNPEVPVQGGRSEALKLLAKDHRDYAKTHNFLYEETTGLSPYIKFGCVSIREVYHKYQSVEPLVRQLYWREFYATLLYAFPEYNEPVDKKYNKIQWSNNRAHFNAWTKGETGFPVVDACMRQLVQTGTMHNRGRLIVASFLCKTLLIDWRWGERFFAQHLVDYDVASNMHNWLWIAGGGADSQEYFRIFNPWSQSENYDKDGVFISKYLPELDVKDIHNPEKHKTIVDYAEQKTKVLNAYKDIFR